MNSSSLSIFDELDQAIDRVITDPGTTVSGLRTGLAELLEMAPDLLRLPRAEFKTRLMVELDWQASGRAISAPAARAAESSQSDLHFLSAMSGTADSLYPVQGANFAVSVALHAALLLFVSLGVVMVGSTARILRPQTGSAVVIESYIPSTGDNPNHGGGGGGSHDKLGASKGVAPHFDRQQLAPPAVLLPDQTPKLTVEATLVGPPDLNLPRTDSGDPLSNLVAPSSGVGASGIGSGRSDGVGPGSGPGSGPGHDGGFGGDAFAPGNGVSLPRAIYSPEPEFSDEARMAKYQGVVTLTIVVTADGRPVDIHVSRALGMGLDEKALAAVRTWRFEPGKKDGHPVAVRMDVEVDFHLY
jgi:periplasmic protein TonB